MAIKGAHKPCLLQSMDEVAPRIRGGTQILLIHASSIHEELSNLLTQLADHPSAIVAVASDKPILEEMLSLSQYGIRAYFNSYMADTHYRHMLRLLEAGQTWFAPQLLARALEIARRSPAGDAMETSLTQLTPREKDVALAVARGMSNKRIANTLEISERTVKTHLTRVFEKLDIKDRVTLAIRLNAA